MAGDLMAMSGAAYDAQALNGLKRDAAADPQGNLKQVAQQVEGMFVQMMLKSMRSALPQDGVLSSDQTRLYTSMYDQQIAQQMSQKGLGLADMMVKQMSNANTVPSETAGLSPMALDNEVLQTLPNQALEQMVRRAMPKAPPAAAPLSLNNGNFVARLSIPAKVASQQSGIPHQLIVAQAALTTTEFEQGAAKKVKAKFRVYGSYVEAIADYVKLLTNNPRYADVAAARSPEQAAHALQRAGYATDPQYASKLVSVIQQMKNAGEQAVKAYTYDLKDLF